MQVAVELMDDIQSPLAVSARNAARKFSAWMTSHRSEAHCMEDELTAMLTECLTHKRKKQVTTELAS